MAGQLLEARGHCHLLGAFSTSMASPVPEGRMLLYLLWHDAPNARSTPPGGSQLVPGAWAQLAKPVTRARVAESKGHVSASGSESHCLTLDLSFLTDPH